MSTVRNAARTFPTHAAALLLLPGLLLTSPALMAKLPPPSDEEVAAKQAAAQRRAQEQVRNAYLLCLRQDVIAAAYGATKTAAGGRNLAPGQVPPCKPPATPISH